MLVKKRRKVFEHETKKKIRKICCQDQSIAVDVIVEIKMQKSTRNNRICNFGWRLGCDCNFSNSNFSSKVARVVGCNNKWDEFTLENEKRCNVLKKVASKKAQSTVEFAIIFLVLVGIVVALSVIFKKIDAGLFLDHAILAASHNVEQAIGGWCDVFVF